MSKKVIEGEDNKPSILSKISTFFKKQKGAAEAAADDENMDAKSDDEDADASKADDEDADAKKTDDSDDDASAATADDDDDQDDPDKDDDDDSDEDEIEVNGSVVNLKDPAATRAAIEGLLATNAEQNELLTEAAAELSKTKTQVKNEIKSSFTAKSSKRSTKIGADPKEQELPEGIIPAEGSIAYTAMKNAISRKNAEEKEKKKGK